MQEIIKGEEADFLRTIERGLVALRGRRRGRRSRAGGSISGKDDLRPAHDLRLSADLTRQMAPRNAWPSTWQATSELMGEHEEKSGSGKAAMT